MAKFSGDLTYLHERLGQAISSSMFNERPDYVASVFEILHRGLDDIALKGGPDKIGYLRDSQARGWFETIRKLTTPSAEDGAHPRAKELGSWAVLAGRLTDDEYIDLRNAMWELYHHVGRYTE